MIRLEIKLIVLELKHRTRHRLQREVMRSDGVKPAKLEREARIRKEQELRTGERRTAVNKQVNWDDEHSNCDGLCCNLEKF